MRFPLVDALRALAALLIVGYHVAFVSGGLGPDGAGPWLAGLNLGVPLFFAISGFLLYRPWVAARLAGTPPPSWRSYGLRRVLRIAPAYWVALVLIVLLLGRRDVFDWPGALVYLGLAQGYDPERFTGGIGQAWTLDDRGRVLRRPAAARARGAAAARPRAARRAAAARRARRRVAGVAGGRPGHGRPRRPGLLRAAARAAGAARRVRRRDGARGGERGRPGRALRRPRLGGRGAGLRDGGAVAAGRRLAARRGRARAAGARGGRAARAGGPGRRRRRSGALGPRVAPAGLGGLVSYGVYLWHLDVLRELAERDLPVPVLAVAGTALSIALGAASWYGIERLALRLGRRGSGAPRPRPAAAEPAGR